MQKLLDAKSYKKALKSVDKVLVTKEYHDHPECLCLKGLIMYESGQCDEGRELTLRGQALGKTSFFVWDVRSRVLESDGEIAESAKAMKMATMMEKDTERAKDMRIKLSMAQFRSQDYVGFLETRTAILNEAPDEARSWGPCAVGAQFMGDYATALLMIKQYVSSVRKDLPPHELSELLFYELSLLRESGNLAGALAFIEKEEEHLVERRRLREQRVGLLVALERPTEALADAAALLEINSEDARYLHWVAQSRGVLGDLEAHVALFDELQKRFPRSASAKRAVLNLLPASDARFLSAFQTYYQPLLEKGAPSAFASLKSLYKDAAKVAVIEKQIMADLASLRASSTFAGDAEKANPSTLLWMLYFVAQHEDKLSRWTKALTLIDEALAHTCTLQELYVCKARICKHLGDVETAYLLTDRARVLDTADRWLNAKCVGYALAANRLVEADARMGIFSRAEEGFSNVYDMQNQRYILGVGLAHLRLGEYGKGLKLLLHLIKVYDQMVVDHFELLRFSMGASTIKAWTDMGRYMETARCNPTFTTAIGACVDTYLKLYIKSGKADKPKEKSSEEMDAEWAAMSPKTRKKAKQDYRRDQAAKEAAAAVAPPNRSQRSILFIKGDLDPVGDGLLQKDELHEAHRLVKMLVHSGPELLANQVLAGRVAVHRKKLVQALHHLNKAVELSAAKDGLTSEVRYLAALILNATPTEPQLPVVDAARAKCLEGCQTSAEYVTKFLDADNVDSLFNRLKFDLLIAKTEPTESLLTKCAVEPADLHQCKAIIILLASSPLGEKLADTWKAHCRKTFPGPVFGGESISAPELQSPEKAEN